MAYIASRKAQEAVKSIVEGHPQALAGNLEDIRTTLQTAIEEAYSTIEYEMLSRLKTNSTILDFPTTFSAAVVQETSRWKRVMLFWVGDSPLFICAPDGILTTYRRDDGGNRTGGAIHLGNYALHAEEFYFAPDTPLLVVAASDGLAKLGDAESPTDLIIEAVQKGAPERVAEELRGRYWKGTGDDVTVAMVSSMWPGEQKKLSASAPTRSIS